MCQGVMAFLVRQTSVALILGLLIFCSSCEKHHLGEIPEVQREQVDPEKAWSSASEKDSDKLWSSPTPAEFFPESTPP